MKLLCRRRKSYEAENVVLSRPERKRLFSDMLKLVSEDLVSKIDGESVSV